MGHDYKGGTETFHSINDNLKSLRENYPYKNGYFGTVGKSGTSSVRNIASDNPIADAHRFYDMAAYGGIEQKLSNGKGWKTTMEDGTVFTMREVSRSDGSPAVDINIQYSTYSGGVKNQKIHFVKKGM